MFYCTVPLNGFASNGTIVNILYYYYYYLVQIYVANNIIGECLQYNQMLKIPKY